MRWARSNRFNDRAPTSLLHIISVLCLCITIKPQSQSHPSLSSLLRRSAQLQRLDSVERAEGGTLDYGDACK